MAKFLATKQIIAEIDTIINKAKNNLVLICPFVRIPENLFQNLEIAAKRKTRISLVYGKSELKDDQRNRLRQIENLSLYFLENLHAKCFYNEKSMVITSFNLLDSSEENREMGVLVNVDDDPDFFAEAKEETERILMLATKEESRVISNIKNAASRIVKRISMTPSGFCIRCGTTIALDPGKPLCPNCFSEWNMYRNPDYEENFCHQCGRQAQTTIAKPLCRTCYNQS